MRKILPLVILRARMLPSGEIASPAGLYKTRIVREQIVHLCQLGHHTTNLELTMPYILPVTYAHPHLTDGVVRADIKHNRTFVHSGYLPLRILERGSGCIAVCCLYLCKPLLIDNDSK